MTAAVGAPLPPVDGLVYVKGTPIVDIGQSQGDRVLVLEFWATWCPPCRTSIPHLSQLQQKYRSQNVHFIGITSENESAVRPFVDKMGANMDYCVALDSQNKARQVLMQPLQITGIPHAIVVNKDNIITFSGHPMDQEFEEKLEEAVKAGAKKQLAPITASREELQAMSIRELKEILTQRHISIVGLAEKGDLVQKILDTCVNVTYSA